MSSNVTQMPVIREYVRVYPSFAEERIASLALYPLIPFRLPTTDMFYILENTLEEAVKIFDPQRKEATALLVNHAVNLALARLDESGKVIHSEHAHGVDITNMRELYGELPFSYTSDGYTVFNPTVTPPTPSGLTH